MYRVKFEIFEGPLDLLLYLIKKQEVDIYQVNISDLATQFLEYIDMMRMLDIEIAGEFLVMAATLLYIKSRELLPVNQRAVDDQDPDELEIDPKWELIRKLLEYKRFKDAALELQKLEAQQEQVYTRKSKFQESDTSPQPLMPFQASIFDLLTALNAVLKRFQTRIQDAEIIADEVSITEKIEFILETLKQQPVVLFSALFEHMNSRMHIVATFLALLELIRTGHVKAIQHQPFGEIQIHRGPNFNQLGPEFVTAHQTTN
jgi:segregation and condensation protein A